MSYLIQARPVNVTRRPGLVSSAAMSRSQPAWLSADVYVVVRELWFRQVNVLEMVLRIGTGDVGEGGLWVERTFEARRACSQAFCWVCTVLCFLRRMLACHLVLAEGVGVRVRR